MLCGAVSCRRGSRRGASHHRVVGERPGRVGDHGLGQPPVGRVRPPAVRVGHQPGRDERPGVRPASGVGSSRSPPDPLGVQRPQRPGQPVDDAVPGPRPPAVHDAARRLVVRGLGLLAARREAHVLAPAARRVRPAHRVTPRSSRPTDTLTASRDTPARRGTSASATPPALRTRSALALTGRDSAESALELGAEAHQRPGQQGGQSGSATRCSGETEGSSWPGGATAGGFGPSRSMGPGDRQERRPRVTGRPGHGRAAPR